MIPCSVDFINAMKNPIKKMYLKIEFYDFNMQYVSEFTKNIIRDDIGDISVDMTRPVRRSFSFSIDNASKQFLWGENNLIWIDKYAKLFIGLELNDKKIEYTPQGVFVLSEPYDTHDFDGQKTYITGQDKMIKFTDKRGKFSTETTVAEGTKIEIAIRTIAGSGGETMFNFDKLIDDDGIDIVTPYEITYSNGDNRYKAMQELAELGRALIYYDVNGYLRLKKIDLNDINKYPEVWAYQYGKFDEIFYAGNVRKFDESNLANHIRVYAGSSQTATTMYDLKVTDTNPLWLDNPYTIEKIGDILYEHNNGSPDSLLKTKDECKWRAKWELMNRLGYSEKVSLQIAPNWLHNAGDIIKIEDERNNVTGKYLLESFSIPLNISLMSCECKKQRNILEDWDFI